MNLDVIPRQTRIFAMVFGAILILQFVLWIFHDTATEWLDILGILAIVGGLHGIFRQYHTATGKH